MTTTSYPDSPWDLPLAKFCHKLPKIELHAHLTGSISRQTLHEIWKQKKERDPAFEMVDPLLEIPVGKVDYDLETFFPLFTRYIYNLCNDLLSVHYSTHQVLTSFESSGTCYLELRTTPRAFPATGMTAEEYVSAVLDAIDEYSRRPETKMVTRLILSVDRRDTLEKAMATVQLAVKLRERGVVGVDLCGDPMKGDISLLHPAFTLAKSSRLGITLHFAEIPYPPTPTELQTLLSFQPDRLGHVIHVSEAIKDEIARRGLALELCLSCNIQAKMMAEVGGFGDHHFGEWYKGRETRKCGLVICTDDVGVFCSDLANEYYLVAMHFGLTKKELWELSRNAVKAIFAGEEVKRRLEEQLMEFARLE
ncbi:putative adenosine deaminase [Ascodesmis nigricans]|uniref:Putative adenosine deaminase n=1 Tax=Ascodesmis nigricans TaxID=341454 RepID=A0A4S2N711_9PEZI|nr:putative adenosine deaminase [Ascodesmis nigricans]